MKINKDIFKTYLNTISISPGSLMAVFLKFEEDGVHTTSKDLANIMFVDGILHATAFEDYSDYATFGIVGIVNPERLSKALNSFGQSLEITTNDIELTFKSGKKEITLVKANKELYQEIALKLPSKAECYECNFEIDKAELKDYVSFSSVAEEKSYLFETSTDTLTIKTESDYKIKQEIDMPGIKEGVKALFGEPFSTILTAFDGEITIAIEDDKPMLFYKDTDNMSIKAAVAPRIRET